MPSYTDEQKLADFIHPWCKRLFLLKRKFLAIEANPEVCCMFCVANKPTSCEIAQKNYQKLGKS